MRRLLFLALIALLGLTPSLTVPAFASEDQFIGLVTGAAMGGVIGNQFGKGGGRVATTAGGVLAGGWAGSEIGRSMDNAAPGYRPHGYAHRPAPSVEYQTAYVPNYVAPPSPPPEIYADRDTGSYCRAFSQDRRINGRTREVYGTACLQADGTWRVVE